MRVSVVAEEGTLTVVITDRGRAFDPEEIGPPDLRAAPEDRRPGGLGWHLIRSTVDAYRYEPGTRGDNRLTLVKRTGEGKS